MTVRGGVFAAAIVLAALCGFVRAAAQAKSVLVTYAATPESRAVRYDLAGFQEGARGLLNACEDALK